MIEYINLVKVFKRTITNFSESDDIENSKSSNCLKISTYQLFLRTENYNYTCRKQNCLSIILLLSVCNTRYRFIEDEEIGRVGEKLRGKWVEFSIFLTPIT